ncbi:MAG: hypothetical protein KA053_09010 [Lentimicrobiaceae bacterium]|nr:hypothetical protein [Lentimicrobiaceae bacterium]
MPKKKQNPKNPTPKQIEQSMKKLLFIARKYRFYKIENLPDSVKEFIELIPNILKAYADYKGVDNTMTTLWIPDQGRIMHLIIANEKLKYNGEPAKVFVPKLTDLIHETNPSILKTHAMAMAKKYFYELNPSKKPKRKSKFPF